MNGDSLGDYLRAARKHVPTQEDSSRRIATRRFIEQSCELAKRLPIKKKCLFLMRYESGFSHKEIADMCGVDETTVSRRIKKIAEELNTMRTCCDGEEDGTK